MTNEELIDKIKAEIERRIKIQDDWAGRKVLPGRDLAFAVKEELKQLLSFLDTLESETPMNLEEEISRYLREECSDDDEPSISDIARHFAQWGAEHLADARKTSPNDLEEASSKFATHTASNGVSVEFLEEKLSFQEGAKWDRRQIMKNAKDGWIDEECVIVLNDGTRIDLQPDYEKKPAFEFEYAQDVQVIILPRENSNDTRRKE